MSLTYKELVEEFGFNMWPKDDIYQGRVGSAVPIWYQEELMLAEEDQIDDMEAQAKSVGVESTYRHEMKMQIDKARERFDRIRESMPQPTGVKRDKLASIVAELGEIIKSSLFSYSDMHSGKAKASEERRRNWDMVIPINSNEAAKWVIYCGGTVVGERTPFKTSRNNLIRAWKYGRFILEAHTWYEELRPDETVQGARLDVPYYRRTKEKSTGFTLDDREIKLNNEDTTFGPDETENVPRETKGSSDQKLCDDCKGSMVGEPHLAKRCKPCREKRKQDAGREDTDKDAGGSS